MRHKTALLVLQNVFLLHAFVATGLCITPVLEGPAFLLQADHIVFSQASEVTIELPHRHGHELVVRKAVLDGLVPVVSGLVVLLMMCFLKAELLGY